LSDITGVSQQGGNQGWSDADPTRTPQIEYGIAENDIQNRFALSLNYELPPRRSLPLQYLPVTERSRAARYGQFCRPIDMEAKHYCRRPDPPSTKGGKRLCSSQYTNGAYQQAQPFPFSDGTTLDVDPEIARTLYFSSDRAVPAHFPRSPEQAQLDFKHVDSLGWFSGYANVWSIPISAFVECSRTGNRQRNEVTQCEQQFDRRELGLSR
jgi:hypothetical protein